MVVIVATLIPSIMRTAINVFWLKMLLLRRLSRLDKCLTYILTLRRRLQLRFDFDSMPFNSHSTAIRRRTTVEWCSNPSGISDNHRPSFPPHSLCASANCVSRVEFAFNAGEHTNYLMAKVLKKYRPFYSGVARILVEGKLQNHGRSKIYLFIYLSYTLYKRSVLFLQ